MGNPIQDEKKIDERKYAIIISNEQMMEKINLVINTEYHMRNEQLIWDCMSIEEKRNFINWFCFTHSINDLCYYFAIFYEGKDTDNQKLSQCLRYW
jgi:hypothetical protein